MMGKRVDTKVIFLEQHGALNPRPEGVLDELFSRSDFFDPRDLIQVKYEMLRRVRKDSLPVTQASAAFGFSRPAFYQIQQAYAQGGLPGLLPQKRGPRRAHKLNEDVVSFIGQARSEDPSLNIKDMTRLVRDRFGIVVHPRSIERSLKRKKNETTSRGSAGQPI
jgi:transposase